MERDSSFFLGSPINGAFYDSEGCEHRPLLRKALGAHLARVLAEGVYLEASAAAPPPPPPMLHFTIIVGLCHADLWSRFLSRILNGSPAEGGCFVCKVQDVCISVVFGLDLLSGLGTEAFVGDESGCSRYCDLRFGCSS